MVYENLIPAAWIAVILAFLAVFVVAAIIIYIYSSLAVMTIAKKTKTEPAYLAWIPIANYYLMSKIAKMEFWPILFLFGAIIIGAVIPSVVGFIVAIILTIIFFIFTIIWNWKIFEAVKRPGWWSLTMLIPLVIPLVGWIIYLVLLGVAAWGKK